MSAGRPRREVAHRLFAAEFDAATVTIADSDEEMAPTYVLTPGGALVNRAFVVGVLTSVDQVGDDIYRGRINDPTGTFIAYAGQYQPKAANVLAEAETPMFVSLTAKARTFQPDGSDQILSSLRPERIVEADVAARDRWVAEAARHTLARIELFARARAAGVAPDAIEGYLVDLDVRPTIAVGIARATIEYDPSATYLQALRQRAIEALEVVFGDREAVAPLDVEVSASGDTTFDALATERFVDRLREPDAPPLPDIEPVEAAPSPQSDETDTPEPPSPTEFASDDTPAMDSPSTDESALDEIDPPTDDDAETTEAERADIDATAEPASDPDAPADLEALTEIDEQYELSEEERAEVEAEFGTEFATGDEVASPADADDSPAEETEESQPLDTASSEDTDEDTDDLEDTVTATMHDLDGGDGVDRDDLVEAVASATGADTQAIEDAIQSALMSGTCYEPEEGRLKPI